MDVKRKRQRNAANLSYSEDKDSEKKCTYGKVRQLFLDGGKYTAVELNEMAHFNDARKVISVLRAQGWNIRDIRLEDQRKLYWLDGEQRYKMTSKKGGEQ